MPNAACTAESASSAGFFVIGLYGAAASGMRGSGADGSTPVAIPAGAPPVPPTLPDTAPDVELLGIGGTTVGIVVGATSGAGAPFAGGVVELRDPLPVGSPRGSGTY